MTDIAKRKNLERQAPKIRTRRLDIPLAVAGESHTSKRLYKERKRILAKLKSAK